MSLNKSVTITSAEGHEYVLGFSSFDSMVLPDSITKKIIEVVIAIEDYKGINNAKTLFALTKHIKSYLAKNDVILYSYCDNKDIERGERHRHLTPQQYRSLLFQTMFNKDNSNEFINKPIELTDANNEKHYIHLFARVESIEQLEVASNELYKLNK